MTDTNKPNSYSELVRAVADASQSDDPWDVVKGLMECGYIEVLMKVVGRRFPGFSRDLIHEAVSQAVDSMVSKLRSGSSPLQRADRYLLRAALNIASDLSRDQMEVGLTENVPEAPSQWSAPERPEPDHDATVAALRRVRELIPLTGSQIIQDVLTLIFDAAEAGIEELSSTEIGERLDLSPSTVRTCKQRGLQRLERHAVERGIVSDYLHLAGLNTTEEITEEAEA